MSSVVPAEIAALAAQGFVMPAEWAPHEATQLTWPRRPEIWRGVHEEVEQTFAAFAARLSLGERVHLLVPDKEWEHRAKRLILRAGGLLPNISFWKIDSDDVWARDHGPTCLVNPKGDRRMLDWKFNAWGGKFASSLDDAIPRQLAEKLGWERLEPGVVMEGGAIEVNGEGDLLVTEAVLLNPNRNPGWTREALTELLFATLGCQRIHWLGGGPEGDDTDGHIDDIARFAPGGKLLIVSPVEGDHPDRETMLANWERARGFRGPGGRPFELVGLPVPEPVHFGEEHLPASYANFYIGNDAVVVPVFAQRTDAEALAVIGGCFPDREVVGLDCRALVSQYGALHCVSQQIPAAASSVAKFR
jgi:agmatine deiminase